MLPSKARRRSAARRSWIAVGIYRELSGSAGSPEIWEQAGRVMDCENLDLVACESVDDAVSAQDDLPVVLLSHFRDHPPRSGELLQTLD